MIDKEYFKEKLEAEKVLLEKELADVGRKNPDAKDDWVPAPADEARVHADDNLAADDIEEFGENMAIVNTLESRYNEVKKAFERIDNSTYGICSVCGAEIEQDRLEANPSASTCKNHMA